MIMYSGGGSYYRINYNTSGNTLPLFGDTNTTSNSYLKLAESKAHFALYNCLVLGHTKFKGVQRVYCNLFPKNPFYGSHRLGLVTIRKLYHVYDLRFTNVPWNIAPIASAFSDLLWPKTTLSFSAAKIAVKQTAMHKRFVAAQVRPNGCNQGGCHKCAPAFCNYPSSEHEAAHQSGQDNSAWAYPQLPASGLQHVQNVMCQTTEGLWILLTPMASWMSLQRATCGPPWCAGTTIQMMMTTLASMTIAY